MNRMMFVFLAVFVFCFFAMPLCAQGVDQTTTTTLKRPMLNFVDLSEWIIDPDEPPLRPPDSLFHVVELPLDPVIGETGNRLKFIVEGRDLHGDFTIGVILNGGLHVLLLSKNIRKVEDRFFFEYPIRMLGPLKKGAHTLTLRINPEDKQMKRNSSNEHTMRFVVK